MKKIVLVGDSLTQYGYGTNRALLDGGSGAGWGDRLCSYYARRADIINRGCAGYTTRDCLKEHLTILPSSEFLFGTLWFGANDSCDENIEKGKHVDIDEYEKNLKEIYLKMKNHTLYGVIILSPPPIVETKYKVYRKNNGKEMDRSNILIEKYVQSAKSLANQLKAPFINTFEAFIQHQDYESLLCEDGLHFSSLGDEFIHQLLIKKIEENWKDLLVFPDPFGGGYSNSGTKSKLEPLLPYWDKLDVKDFKNQLDSVNVSPTLWPLRKSILLIGDSLTQFSLGNPEYCSEVKKSPGWGDLIHARYSRRLDVFNRGFSGYNSRWILSAISKIFEYRSSEIELVTIFLGANDGADQHLNPKQHVPLDEFELNLKQIIQYCLLQFKAKRIVVIGCPPIVKHKYLSWRRARKGNETKTEEELLDRSYEVAKMYSDISERVASQSNLPFLNLFHEFGEEFEILSDDGLHLNQQGNIKLGLALIKLIDKVWPEMKCSPDKESRYGYHGSTCVAFNPEQKWAIDIQEEYLAEMKKRVKLDSRV